MKKYILFLYFHSYPDELLFHPLQHVQRPLLSFGPKASMKLRTSPVNVCKVVSLIFVVKDDKRHKCVIHNLLFSLLCVIYRRNLD